MQSEEKPAVKPVDNPKKPGGKPEDKDKRKPQKPPTKQEGNLAKTIILQDIVGLQKIEFFFSFFLIFLQFLAQMVINVNVTYFLNNPVEESHVTLMSR